MCNEYFCEHTKRFIYIFLSITFYGTRFLFGFFRHILHKICIFAKINHFLTFLNIYLFKIGLFLLTLFATNTFVTHCMYICTIDSASSTQHDACHFIIAAKEVGRVGALLK